MPTQAYPYLALSDGTTTIVFADGLGGSTNYAPIRDTWAPASARYQINKLAGHGSYEDVTEELTINVRGATVAAALANLGALAQLLDQADRWWKGGEDVNPVVIKFAPQGSTLVSTASPLQAIVLGRADGDETAINLSERFATAGMTAEIMDVRVRFVRRGLWIGPTDTGAATGVFSGATSNASYGSSAWQISSPVKLSLAIAGTSPATVGAISDAVLLLAHSGAGIDIAEMETLTAAKYTSVADVANKARNNNVLHYTPTDTAFQPTGTSSSGVSSTTTRIGVWLFARSSTTACTWTIRAVATYAATLGTVRTPDYVFVPADTNPTILFLGYLASDYGFGTLGYEIKASTTSGGPTLDMDCRALLIGSSEYVRALAMDPLLGSGTVTATLQFDPAPLTKPRAQASYSPSATPGPITYRGDAYTTIASASAAAVATTYFALLGTSGNYWRLVDTSANLAQITFTGTRYTAYPTPQ